MKISVIMPVYNGEKYLGEAIDSILTQTFADFELIIINDCSTDKTEEIIKSYRDKRIVYVKNEQNQGVAATLNRGIDLAKGEYIARMDADDISLPTRFEKQVAFMDAHPQVGVCGSNAVLFSGSKTVRTTDLPLEHEQIKGEMLFFSQIMHPSVMLRKSVVADELYDSAWNGREDYELWLRLLSKTQFHNMKEALLKYRIHAGQVTGKKEKQLLDIHTKLKFEFLRHNVCALNWEEARAFSKYCIGMHVFSDCEIQMLCDLLERIKQANFLKDTACVCMVQKRVKAYKKTRKLAKNGYIITCHDVYNYGASLQCYALQQYLLSEGLSTEVIDYIPSYISRLFDFKTPISACKANVLKKMALFVYLCIIQAKCVPKYIRYKKFNRKYLQLTPKRYKNNAQLLNLENRKFYFCGSDQIWNSYNFDCGKDPAFFNAFAPKNAFKVAYAASFGSDKIAEGSEAFLLERLQDFSNISVREESGIRILEAVGISNAECVADPVFLLDRRVWNALVPKKEKPKKSYQLLYCFDNAEKIKAISTAVKRAYGLQIMDFSFHGNAYTSGPLEFLYLIKNAEIVITNSFHAIAFCILFKKQFIAVKRAESGLSERLLNILKLAGLENRIVDTAEEAEKLCNQSIDYDTVDSKMQNKIEFSRDYIRRCLDAEKHTAN